MHQPWASLLVWGIKRIEGRSWQTNHRGRLWVHATSQQPSPQAIKVSSQYAPSRSCSHAIQSHQWCKPPASCISRTSTYHSLLSLPSTLMKDCLAQPSLTCWSTAWLLGDGGLLPWHMGVGGRSARVSTTLSYLGPPRLRGCRRLPASEHYKCLSNMLDRLQTTLWTLSTYLRVLLLTTQCPVPPSQCLGCH